MDFNQRTDYLVSRALALGWWKVIQSEDFAIQDASVPVRADTSAKPGNESAGPWAVVARGSMVGGVVVQSLADGSGQWGLAVLWYDSERYSPLTKVLSFAKLSRSKSAARQIGASVLKQGGREFACAAQPPQKL